MRLVLALLLAASARAAKRGPEIMASSLVSSDEVRIRRTPTRLEEFIGRVRYRSRGDLITADWAAYDHASRSWDVRGSVLAEHRFTNGDKIQARGQRARYDMDTELGSLVWPGRDISLTRLAEDGTSDFGSAKKLEWRGRELMSLVDEAHFWGPRLEAWAERADLDPARKALELSGGRPALRNFEGSWVGALKADRIAAFDAQGRRLVSADGKVLGWLEFRKK